MAETIDLKQAAHRLGVHYQTAYRWVREGRLPVERRNGRYEIDPDELDRFAASLREPGPPAPPATGSARRDWPALADRFAEDLVAGDERRLRAAIDRLTGSGEPVVAVLDRVVAPALAHIGEAWAAGQVTIAEEHRASALVARLVAGLAAPRRGRPRGSVVVVGPEGDRHELPGTLAAAALVAEGWRVEHLGTDLPADTVADLLDASAPDLLVVSRTTPDGDEGAARLVELAGARDLPVLVGSPGRTLQDLLDDARRAVRGGDQPSR